MGSAFFAVYSRADIGQGTSCKPIPIATKLHVSLFQSPLRRREGQYQHYNQYSILQQLGGMGISNKTTITNFLPIIFTDLNCW
jgi:hypothetical protein